MIRHLVLAILIGWAALPATAQEPASPIDPQNVVDSFLSICVRELGDPAALREAINRSPLGFARVADDQRFEVYRSAQARVRFEPGRACEFETRLLTRDEGEDTIVRLSAATRQEVPPGAVNRSGTAASYRWPQPAQAGRVGMAAGLEWGRFDTRASAEPVRLNLWAYLAEAQ